jgi:tetratricopeptide (TPR) repeat protein
MRRALRCALQLAVLFLVLASIAAPALAGPKQDWRDCERGSPDEAIQGCTRIIKGGREGKHNLAIAYNERGIAYDNKGQYDRGIADFDQAIKLDPNYAKAYFNRGTTYRKTGHLDRAIADYNQAIKLNPKDAVAYAGRGLAYEHKGEKKRAIADYRKAIELFPGLQMATEGLKRLGVTP